MLAVISDRKFGVSSGGSLIDYYEPDIIAGNDYYPFGMLSRVATTSTGVHYRYGFNGKEHLSEAKGWQNQYDYGMRVYDARVGRFLSVDPLTEEYPELTPYQYASNTPIQAIDLDGLEGARSTGARPTGRGGNVRVMTEVEVMARNTARRLREGERILQERARKAELARQIRTGTREFWRRFERGIRDYISGVVQRTEAEFVPSGPIVKPPREITDAQRAAVLGSQGLVKIKTPYQIAEQDITPAAIEALSKVKEGATLYRIGTLGKSAAAEAQFWSLENPALYLKNPKVFAEKYGIPAENLQSGAIFIETGTLKPGQPFITRPAPAVGTNKGGEIEVVTNPGAVKLETFNVIKQE